MTEQAISPLRRRMIEDMTIRKLAPKTQQGYIRTIKDLAAFIGHSPQPDRTGSDLTRRNVEPLGVTELAHASKNYVLFICVI
jgi:hypothetical protein